MKYDQRILFVDGTPDDGYPLRILKAYRELCDKPLSSHIITIRPGSPLAKVWNDLQARRAKILDRAIEKLNNE